MEALAAIGLVSSIVQFVDFAAKLANGTRQIYQSGAVATDENADLEVCASELDGLCSRIHHQAQSSAKCADKNSLCLLATQCQTISTELAVLLRRVKAKNSASKWSCFVSALKTQLTRDERESLSRRLEYCRAQLNVQLSHLAK
jgi:hypothetical protein